MKKYFLFFATAMMLGLAGCSEPDPVIPIDDDPENPDNPENPDSPDQPGFVEKTFVVSVELMDGVNTDYGAGEIEVPGAEILSFLGLDDQEFRGGMGTVDGSSDQGTTSQINQKEPKVMFGVAQANNIDNLNWVPQTSSNFGHWFDIDGNLTTWGDSMAGDAFFYTESTYDWAGAESADGMWTVQYGVRPDIYSASGAKPGDVYKFTEVFFVTDDKDVEHYAYLEWNVKIVEAEEVTIDIVGSADVKHTVSFDAEYIHYALDLPVDDIVAKLGIDPQASKAYAVNSDGSLSATSTYNFWFSLDGDVVAWGENAAVCTVWGEDANPDFWAFCLYPNEELIGQTAHASLVFANESGQGYQVNFTIDIAGQDTWTAGVEVSVGGDCVDANFDLDAVASYLGYEGADALAEAILAKEATVVALNSDGSEYTEGPCEGGHSQAGENDGTYFLYGSFFDYNGDCTVWDSGSDMFYFNCYCFDGAFGCDITPFGADEDNLGAYAYTFAIKANDKVAYLKYNISLVSAIPWASYECDGTTVNIKMLVNNDYKGLRLDIDNAAIASALGVEDLAAAVSDGTVQVAGLNADGTAATNADGTLINSGETPFGHWFNKSGDVCSWGADACAFCFNVKADDGVYVNVCQFPESAATGDAWTGKQQFINGEKTVTVTYSVSIVDEI